MWECKEAIEGEKGRRKAEWLYGDLGLEEGECG